MYVRARSGSLSDYDDSSESPNLEPLEPQPAWRGTRDLFDSDSDDDDNDALPLLVDDSDDEQDSDDHMDPDAGRPMATPSPPHHRRFRFLGRLPPPPNQRPFRFLREHQRPRDLPEDDGDAPRQLDDDDAPRQLVGPVRPLSPDSVSMVHMINATGGESSSVPPAGHGVLDSGATVTVLTGNHRTYFTDFDVVPGGPTMATAARGGTLEINGGGRAGVFIGWSLVLPGPSPLGGVGVTTDSPRVPGHVPR
jgi:hypothetical protein